MGEVVSALEVPCLCTVVLMPHDQQVQRFIHPRRNGFTYVVDFAKLMQHNTTNGGQRRVKRVALAPGVQPPLYESAVAEYERLLATHRCHRAALAVTGAGAAPLAAVRSVLVPAAGAPARDPAGAGAASGGGHAGPGAGSSTDPTGVCVARCALHLAPLLSAGDAGGGGLPAGGGEHPRARFRVHFVPVQLHPGLSRKSSGHGEGLD